MIRLIATDVDGTLLPESSPHLNPEYFEVIRQLKSLGIQVVVATGRHIDSVLRLFEPVKDELFYICDNGAMAGTSSRCILEHPLDAAAHAGVLRDCEGLPECEVISTSIQTSYVYRDARPEFKHLLRDEYRFTIQETERLENVPGIIKVSVYHDRDILGQAGWLMDKWSSQMEGVVAGSNWIDFMAPGISKGQALRELMEEMGISRNEVMSFGDQMNDLEMIRMAGWGCAVANACEPCRQAARRIVPSYREDGVLRTLKELVCRKGEEYEK